MMGLSCHSFQFANTSALVSSSVRLAWVPQCRQYSPFLRSFSSRSTSASTSTSTCTSTDLAMENTAVSDQSSIAVGSVRQIVSRLVQESLKSVFPEDDTLEVAVSICQNNFGDYQCNNAMKIFSKLKGKSTVFKNPNAVGQAIAKGMPVSPMIEKISVAGPGFVNILLATPWIEEHIHKMLSNGVSTWAPVLPAKRAIVDFSSPNIAKEMHVGHLRSTIIGDSLAKMLEYCNVDVLRRNHVGDWGTQFGMLIQYLFEEHPDWEESDKNAIGDLQDFYKRSKVKFESDPAFKERAQQAVVKLQGGEEKFRNAWKQMCEISRIEFNKVYDRLQVTLEEKGESFYNPYIPGALKELEEKGLIEDSEGARVIFIEGQNIPLIVVKRDGGFNYASTDLAALWYRLNKEKADLIVYVTDVGQSNHFDMFFAAARKANWLPADRQHLPQVKHVGFGLVLGEDGKRFRSRSTEVVKLVDLLDEAITRSKQGLIERGREDEWSAEELNNAAKALGYGAIKYADLKNNRLTNYTFNFDQMLDVRGNTAVYLLYAHARICSIITKSGKSIEELKLTGRLKLTHPCERQLGVHLLQFAESVEDALQDMLPSAVCEYLYNLSELFTKFYTNCKVVGSEEETSRLLLCEATATVMRACFTLLGITPLYRL